MANDFAFEMAASAVRFGAGVTREVGADLAELGARHVLVITDRVLRDLAPVQTVVESIEARSAFAISILEMRQLTDAQILASYGPIRQNAEIGMSLAAMGPLARLGCFPSCAA